MQLQQCLRQRTLTCAFLTNPRRMQARTVRQPDTVCGCTGTRYVPRASINNKQYNILPIYTICCTWLEIWKDKIETFFQRTRALDQYHPLPNMQKGSGKEKTEMCFHYLNNGLCPYNPCKYAHSKQEMRQILFAECCLNLEDAASYRSILL